MWPWGHLGVGYLCYALWTERRAGDEQTPAAVLAVALGTQFPDLVDKPLAWSVALLPSGRSLAHSLLVAAPVIGSVYRLGRRLNRPDVAVAFGIGYVSHSLTDLGPRVVVGLLQGKWSRLEWTTYLLWPLRSAPSYPQDDSFREHFAALALSRYVIVQFALCGVAFAVWLATGAPGVAAVRRRVRNRLGHGT